MCRGNRSILAVAFCLCVAGTAYAQGQAQTQSETQAQPPAQAQSAQPQAPNGQPAEQVTSQPTTVGQVVNNILLREHQEVAALRHYSPIVETYIQDMKWDPQLGSVPMKDHYYLGVADLSKGVVDRSMLRDVNSGWMDKNKPI